MMGTVEDVAEAVLPTRAIDYIRPVYHGTRRWGHAINGHIGRNRVVFDHGGERYVINYTAAAGDAISGFINNGKTQPEGVPLSFLDGAGDVDAFIDVGAHHGDYTVLGGMLNPDANVHAFEPDGYNRSVLQGVLAANDIDATVCDKVVSDHTGKMTFYVRDVKGSQGHSTAEAPNSTAVTHPSVALSDYFNGHGIESAVLKIDAEGEEDAIMADLDQCSYSVEGVVEVHPDKLDTDVEAMLDDWGVWFDRFEYIGESSPEHPNAGEILGHNRPMYYFQSHAPTSR